MEKCKAGQSKDAKFGTGVKRESGKATSEQEKLTFTCDIFFLAVCWWLSES